MAGLHHGKRVLDGELFHQGRGCLYLTLALALALILLLTLALMASDSIREEGA